MAVGQKYDDRLLRSKLVKNFNIVIEPRAYYNLGSKTSYWKDQLEIAGSIQTVNCGPNFGQELDFWFGVCLESRLWTV